MASKSTERLAKMIEEATIDGYGDDENLGGLSSLVEEKLAVPFATVVLGTEITVRNLDLTGERDLPLPTPPPSGAE
jgi:hypothetical protein